MIDPIKIAHATIKKKQKDPTCHNEDPMCHNQDLVQQQQQITVFGNM